MIKGIAIKTGVVLGVLGFTLGGFFPVAALETTATRPGEVRREIRQEIKQDRLALRKLGARAFFTKAVLIAKSGDMAPATLTVNKEGKTFTVNVSATTVLRRRFGGKGNLSEFQINDNLAIVGKWTDEAQTAIDAKLIRNGSIQKRLAVFVGKVRTISGDTLVIDSIARGSQTVTVSPTTKIVSRKETAIALTDIKVGHTIRVKGIWDRQANIVIEVSHIKDYSLPAIVKPASTATTSASQ